MKRYIKKDSIALRLQFEEKGDLSVLQLSSLLYDFNLLYDCIVLSVAPEYSNYKFTPTFWYRGGRPLKLEHSLYLYEISHRSPVNITVVITTVAAALGIPVFIIQAIEKIRNWDINHQELVNRAEKAKIEKIKAEVNLDTALKKNEAVDIFLRLLKRIEENDLTAVDADIYIIDGDPND